LFKLFVQYPQGLRLTFTKIQEALEKDANPSVVSCAVNVITELSDKNPKNYLYLAPSFFLLLTSSSNNWMLIKVVKLLASLVPQEPRLARKLLEPLSNIVKTTQAKSLLYEAVHTITICFIYSAKADGTMPASVPAIVTLCANTLRSFVEEKDQNLKYLGLVGFGSLRKSHPKILSASEYRPLILQCLSDEDVTIRTRALHLLTGMATLKNIRELVVQLLGHVDLATGPYKQELVENIVEMCSAEKYARIPDFAWYFDVLLLQLGHLRGLESSHGELLRNEITNVALRVLPVRRHAVHRSMEVLLRSGEGPPLELTGGGAVTGDSYGDNGRGRQIMPEILPSLAWIVGEYSDLIRECKEISNPSKSRGKYHALIIALIRPKNSQALATSTQKVYIQAAMKVLSAATANDKASIAELEACVQTISRFLPVYTQSIDVEVQERAFTAYQLLKSLNLTDGLPGLTSAEDDDDNGAVGTGNVFSSDSLGARCREQSALLNYLFKPEPMKPISAKVQRKKLQSPNGLDPTFLNSPLDLSIFAELIDEENSHRAANRLSLEAVSFTQQRPMRVAPERPMDAVSSLDVPTTPVSSMSMVLSGSTTSSFQNTAPMFANVETAGNQKKADPFYLDKPAPASGTEDKDLSNRFGTIQLLDSDNDEGEDVQKRNKRKAKKPKRKVTIEPSFMVAAVYESDEDDTVERPVAPGRKEGPGREFDGLANVDLTTPLRPDEVMPVRTHRQVPDPPQPSKEKKSKKKKPEKKTKRKPPKATETVSQTSGGNTIGDLLNLGGSPDIPADFPASAQLMSTNPSNIISTAFDDLLDLTSTPSVPLPGFGTPVDPTFSSPLPASRAPEAASKHKKRPWMKASVKVPSSVSSAVDWSNVSVFYKVFPGDGSSAKVVVRIDNSSNTTISQMRLLLKSCPDVELGDLESGSSLESGKVGPLTYTETDAAQEIKGSLFSGRSSVPIKLFLPASAQFSPREGLSLEDVMNEFNAVGWSSSSAKVEFSVTSKESIIPILCSFMRAAEVEPETNDGSTATLAAQSQQGAQIRLLVKVKEKSVKIDVKCSNASLGKAVASDIKKLVL
jgi:AP-3 complex subunit delta-1